MSASLQLCRESQCKSRRPLTRGYSADYGPPPIAISARVADAAVIVASEMRALAMDGTAVC